MDFHARLRGVRPVIEALPPADDVISLVDPSRQDHTYERPKAAQRKSLLRSLAFGPRIRTSVFVLYAAATRSYLPAMSTSQEQQMLDAESRIKRNPHPDFKAVEDSRPDWPHVDLGYFKTRDPRWQFGQGASDGGESLRKNHVEIDPYEEGSA